MSAWRTPAEASEHTGFAVKTLANWRAMNPPRGPKFKRIGRAIRYAEAELDRFMESGGAAA